MFLSAFFVFLDVGRLKPQAQIVSEIPTLVIWDLIYLTRTHSCGVVAVFTLTSAMMSVS